MSLLQDSREKRVEDRKEAEREKNRKLMVKETELMDAEIIKLQDSYTEKNTESTVRLEGVSPKIEAIGIKPGLAVCARSEGQDVENCGKQVGTVDHLDGDAFIKLNKSDSSDGRHHWIPMGWVETVDTKSIYLNKTKEEFQSKRLNVLPVGNFEKRAS